MLLEEKNFHLYANLNLSIFPDSKNAHQVEMLINQQKCCCYCVEIWHNNIGYSAKWDQG